MKGLPPLAGFRPKNFFGLSQLKTKEKKIQKKFPDF
jgi:hypothetical protein